MASGDEGHYSIGRAALIIKVHPQTLRHYERIELLHPQRSEGGEKGRGIRLYSDRDIARAKRIRRLVKDLGVNLAGVEVILNKEEHAEQLEQEQAARFREYEREIQRLREENQRLKEALARVTVSEPSQPRDPIVTPYPRRR